MRGSGSRPSLLIVPVPFNKEGDNMMQTLQFSIVAANNHYAGFGPGTVNIFRQLIGLEEVKWGDELIITDDLGKDNHESTNKRRTIKTKQTPLSDFLS